MSAAPEFPWSVFPVAGTAIGLFLHWWFGYRYLEEMIQRHRADIERRALAHSAHWLLPKRQFPAGNRAHSTPPVSAPARRFSCRTGKDVRLWRQCRRRHSLGVTASRGPCGSEVMTVGGPVASHPDARTAKPFLGLRRQPGRLALAVFRLPLPLYRRGWGWLLGRTFLLLVHAGRKTGKPYSAVAMVLKYDPDAHEAVIFSAWGQDADWIRNIRARPALQVQIGRESFTPQQRFLTEDESLAAVTGFLHRHPWRSRLATQIMGWQDLRSDTTARNFVSTRPFVAFRPADPSRPGDAAGSSEPD